jgi:hypothetical protein
MILSKEIQKEIKRQKAAHQEPDDQTKKKEEIMMNVEEVGERVDDDELRLSRVTYEQDNKSLLLVENKVNPQESLIEQKADWRSWFKIPMFYQYGLAYMGARLCTNVSYVILYAKKCLILK